MLTVKDRNYILSFLFSDPIVGVYEVQIHANYTSNHRNIITLGGLPAPDDQPNEFFTWVLVSFAEEIEAQYRIFYNLMLWIHTSCLDSRLMLANGCRCTNYIFLGDIQDK